MSVAQDTTDLVYRYVTELPYDTNTPWITAAIAGCAMGCNYGLATAPLDAWAVNVFATHDERDEKDGIAFVGADIQGGRYTTHLQSAQWLSYEVDGKITVERARQLLGALPHVAFLWTTHNHLRTKQAITVGTYVKWVGGPHDGDITDADDTVAAFCAQHKRYSHLDCVRLANDGKIRNDKVFGKLVKVFDITHSPEPKFRIVFPLASPIPIVSVPHGLLNFKRIYRAFGNAVFGEGVYSSESCNPARLHFLGSHKPGQPFEISQFDGVPIDWRTVPLPPLPERPAPERPVLNVRPEIGDDEISHILRSIPPDIERGDWFKCLAAIFHETKANGYHLAHRWSEGDPRYSEHEVESIMDSFSLEHPTPSTLGTLIYFAKQYDPHYQPYRPKLPAEVLARVQDLTTRKKAKTS